MKFEVRVEVRLRPGIADPQGATIEKALPALGFQGVESMRVGKVMRFTVEAVDEAAARAEAEAMCERLLANPVIEDAEIEIKAGALR
ncbi:MAG TPA: phosphoribosylformylglycinamidine synthase subunit PurS [Acidimicrobiales bacterium]|jgi:phosphoribosylformylglycinamidine synthase PurS subunit